ncbi:MAG: lysophospholipid acyltransferase family protein [Rhodospirillaceae bacterium]
MIKTALLRTVARLPLAWLHRVGAGIGWLIYRLSPSYAHRLRENLRASGVWCDEADYRRLLNASIREAGKGVIEIVKIWFDRADAVAALVGCKSWAVVEAAQSRGRGLIFLTPHLGCFEVSAFYGAQRIPITILYRPPRLHWLEPLMLAGRARGKAKLAPATLRGVRALYKALLEGEAVGLLPDQAPGAGEGTWVPFFGRPAYKMTLVTRLQQATGAAIVLAFAERLPHGAGYELHFERVPTEGFDERALNRAIEDLVRRRPEQYLWSYNRYKVPAGAKQPPDTAAQGET